jgi:MFS family permease
MAVGVAERDLTVDQNGARSRLERHPFLRVALLVGLSVLLGAISSAIRGEKTQFLLKEELHLTATGTATLGLLLGIPAYLQPFVGAWTDLFPLLGLRRRSYYLLGLLIAAASTFILGFSQSLWRK